MEKERKAHSIRTKITLLTACAVIVALGIATAIGIVAIRNQGSRDADETITLMCRTGQLNLNSYFEDASYDQLNDQVERARNLFGKVVYETNGVLTYYFRLDPEVSRTVQGFWYVNLDGNDFKEHEVTDITKYDTNDTSQLVWFTVPKTTGKGVWLPRTTRPA